MSKRPIFIFVFTFILMMCPSIMLFNRGGYAYAIPFTFLIVLFIRFGFSELIT